MIISASRRTDIPAFYAKWWMERVRAGFLLTRNPYNAQQIRRVSLLPADVDLIVFWTRQPQPLLRYLSELDELGYRYYFHVTITGYPSWLESATPPVAQAVASFQQLARTLGPERVIWRYDPILLCNGLSIADHLRRFERLATQLAGSTQRVVISLADLYPRVLRELQKIAGLELHPPLQPDELAHLACGLVQIARRHGMTLFSCAETLPLEQWGIARGKCIDEVLIQTLFGFSLPGRKDSGQREACLCIKSMDIGSYQSCLHGCHYCYATTDPRRARHNFLSHNPLSPFLLGEADAKTLAWLADESQGRLF